MDPIKTDFEDILQIRKEIETSKPSGINFLSSRILKDAFMVIIT